MDEDTAGIMVTNPNTLGLFEENIREIAGHRPRQGRAGLLRRGQHERRDGHGDMGEIGVDVLHLNLHKTFSTPHGGGGPGAGPVCVRRRLAPFCRSRGWSKTAALPPFRGYPQSIGKLHAFYGNFGVLVRAYSYILTAWGRT
jgi:glycine dehydrogenase subunit 2